MTELEWACRVAAVRGALAPSCRSPLALFVNVEPNLIAAPVPALFAELLEEARDRLRLVFEITERALAERPAELLRRVAAAARASAARSRSTTSAPTRARSR